MINNYTSHNQEQTHQVAFEVASFATCEKRSSNMPHIKFSTCYKMDNMPNFKLVSETKNEKTKDKFACQKNDDEKNDYDDANCEQWAKGEESPPLVTFQPNWT